MDNERYLKIGIDVGSTTVKTVVLEPETGEVLLRRYRRHHAEQRKTVMALLEEVQREFPDCRFRAAVCGSGGKGLAEQMGAHYIQEVVANACAVRHLYPQARTAIELGGQDAKIIFFYFDPETQQLTTSDMRMNGSCAGGTGAFIDEIASLLKVPTEDFEALAAAGTTVHSISGRCGVFAKTDIQSILNQGGRREDIALSSFHAIVKQTIGGLAQGLEIKAPIIFEGGPLTYDPTLVRVFMERLDLKEEDVIRPKDADTIVACGTALAMEELFGGEGKVQTIPEMLAALEQEMETPREQKTAKPFFASQEEQEAWQAAHALPVFAERTYQAGQILPVYIGIDAGSTTSKFVLIDEKEEVIDRFYANNQGDPIRVVKQGLMEMERKYRAMGVTLKVLGLGTTGYGERLLGCAFGADHHTVETVAHAAAASKVQPDVSFILDIGGQDMKAIWIHEGIITDIMLNEACSSGCGSFLENFATSLHIGVEGIAAAAFASQNPAVLGSRCTVFMNSTIITEQRNGKTAQDAGLCRSIIENVFTKVVRITDKSVLGKKIVAQGGTFRNDAVLCALEQYLGCPVTRAPYPGEMGALGIALLTKRRMEGQGRSAFIGFDRLEDLTYQQENDLICPNCANHCKRTVIRFSSGAAWVTGNRCERGGVIGAGEGKKLWNSAPDLFLMREKWLFEPYPYQSLCEKRRITIGIPRSLEFWDSCPFWTTYFRALGFDVKLSHKSSREMFEKGLPFVASDTVCFPAKLSHGHIRDLIDQGVDRIFMPMVMEMPPADKKGESEYVCAVVKGYPLIIRHSENPQRRWEVPFDTPMFHWHRESDRRRQIADFMTKTFGIEGTLLEQAYAQAESALMSFRQKLHAEAERILDQVTKEGSFAVALAGRPYHTDPLVSHDLSRSFTRAGIPVLTVDSLPELTDVDLSHTRAAVTNNFHTRMLSGAALAARHPGLEYVQIVSFGCGHDAILSDEIIRIMKEISGKTPLILKLDEGGAANSLNIRVQSFLETVKTRRVEHMAADILELPDAYSAKFCKGDRKIRTVLVPNVSATFCRLLSAILEKHGLRAVPMPVGGVEQIQLGKRYVHNDTCFPAQMVIGEAISALQSGKYPRDQVAVAMAKYQGDCRLSHYCALLRRAMDAAGFSDVPIVSTDPQDSRDMHPGVRMGNLFNIASLWAVEIMDILEELRRQIRPYEVNKGQTDAVFDASIDRIAEGLRHGTAPAVAAYKKAIDAFCAIPYDRSHPKPRVFVTGEYLVTFHPGSNFHIEEYLEANGMEVILPRMINVFRKDYFAKLYEMDHLKVKYPPAIAIFSRVAEKLFIFSQDVLEKEAKRHPLYEAPTHLPQLAEETESVMNCTFLSGEGWLIPGEIREYAQRGVRSFIILQPFGCLPNHICGRGVMKRIKEEYPGIQILPLDLDPDTSFANVENRLQMLILSEKSREDAGALQHQETELTTA